jgi:hypothetical protein
MILVVNGEPQVGVLACVYVDGFLVSSQFLPIVDDGRAR